jgi:hypothetical protein
LLRNLAKQRECSIENTAIIRPGNDPVPVAMSFDRLQPESVTSRRFIYRKLGKRASNIFNCPKNKCIFMWKLGMGNWD